MGENIPNIGSRTEYKRYCTVHTWDKMLYKPVTGHPEKVTTVGPCRHRSKVPLKMVCAAVMAKDAARHNVGPIYGGLHDNIFNVISF